MTFKFAVIFLLCIGLVACATPPAPSNALDATDHSLAEASFSVSRSIVSLSETAQAAHPLPDLPPPPSPATYGMAQFVSIDWSGPIEPLIRQLAKASNYCVRVLGRPPAIPVLVSVYDKNMMLGDVLRDVSYQAGCRATIVVYPQSRTIELRYAKN